MKHDHHFQEDFSAWFCSVSQTVKLKKKSLEIAFKKKKNEEVWRRQKTLQSSLW